ncbi:MAG TPA: hypothetical protein V6C57_21765 [Coleofasciculaceae cyanobacterium]
MNANIAIGNLLPEPADMENVMENVTGSGFCNTTTHKIGWS